MSNTANITTGGSCWCGEPLGHSGGCRYAGQPPTGNITDSRDATIASLTARATTAETALRDAREVMLKVIGRNGNKFSQIDAVLLAALSAAPQTEAESRNSIALNSFTEYCRSHPSERFWQALRNWSKWSFILAATTRTGAILDTFNLEGLDGTRQTGSPALEKCPKCGGKKFVTVPDTWSPGHTEDVQCSACHGTGWKVQNG